MLSIILSLILLSIMTIGQTSTPTTSSDVLQIPTELIYVGDPMCSWCYGIAEEVSQLWQAYPDIKKTLVLGGLRPGGGDPWNKEFQDFLRHHWEEVSQRSGQTFNFDILNWENFNYDTEPACRAVAIVKSIDEDLAMPFFRAVQHRFYYKNEDPKTEAFYQEICQALSIDYDQFAEHFSSPEGKSLSAKEFIKARSLGVNSFPTILLVHNGQTHLIASGYETFANMEQRIKQIKAK